MLWSYQFGQCHAMRECSTQEVQLHKLGLLAGTLQLTQVVLQKDYTNHQQNNSRTAQMGHNVMSAKNVSPA